MRALRPSLATLAPHSLLIGASSPYSRQGLLWQQYRKHYGRDGTRVLVWQAASRTMNPALPPELIADALEVPTRHCSLCRSGRDRGRRELPRVAGIRYLSLWTSRPT